MRLWATPTQIGSVTALADHLTELQRTKAFGRAAAAFADGFESLTMPIERLPEATAEALLDDKAVRRAIEARLAQSDSTTSSGARDAAAADALVNAANKRADKSPIVLGTLLYDLVMADEPGYAAAIRHRDQLHGLDGAPGLRNLVAMNGMSLAPEITDMAGWAAFIGEAGNRQRYNPPAKDVLEVLQRIFTEWEAGQELDVAVDALLSILDPGASQAAETALRTPLATAIGSSTWWTAAAQGRQQEVHRVVLSLGRLGSPLDTTASSLVAADLARALSEPASDGPLQIVLSAIEATIEGLTNDDFVHIADLVDGLPVSEPLDVPVIQTRIAFSRGS